MNHDTNHGEGEVHVHVTPLKIYIGIFLLLVGLTVLTIKVASIHLGPFNLAVAVLIASIKASFVALYFMHLKYEAKFNAMIFIGSLLFAGIFLAYTTADTEYRAEVDEYNGAEFDPNTGKRAPGGIE